MRTSVSPMQFYTLTRDMLTLLPLQVSHTYAHTPAKKSVQVLRGAAQSSDKINLWLVISR